MLLAVVLLFYAWDLRLKQSDVHGFVPTDASWTLTARNAGSFWNNFQALAPYRRIEDAGMRPLRAFERHVYRRTAVRPNGTRWNVWLGRQAVVAGNADGWGVCTRPGLLLRAATWLHGWGASHTDDGIVHHQEYFYAWRDGFFILSPSEDYVRACLNADPSRHLASVQSDQEIALQWGENWDQELRLRAEPGLPISGQFALAITPRERPLQLHASWPGDAMLTISTTHWHDTKRLYDEAAPHLRRLPRYHATERWIADRWQQWQLPPLPRNWDQGLDECTFSLIAIDWNGIPPIPEAVWAFADTLPGRNEHPLAPLTEEAASIPFVWQNMRGSYTPLLSDSLGIGLARRDEAWYLTTKPDTMANLAAHPYVESSAPADAKLSIDWNQAAEALRDALGPLAESGIVPHLDRRELDYIVLPYIDAFEGMGHLRVEGVMERGALKFRGHLAQGARNAE
jgi:hypothetical protein